MKKGKTIAAITLAVAMMFGGSALAFQATDDITVISREASSGTRAAFDEMMQIVKKTDAGTESNLFEEAVMVDSTDAVCSKVEVDPQAIGYTSLGAITDKVKALPVDGVEANVSTVKDGSYKLARPFVVATKVGADDKLAADFISFIMSASGQKVVTDRGYVSAADDAVADASTDADATADPKATAAATEAASAAPVADYASAGLSGKLTLSGSTSVQNVMDALKDAYVALNPNVTIEITYNGSGAGIKDATEGKVNIAMSSRALTADEQKVLAPTTFAHDGIAVIVNPANTLDKITSAQVNAIYTGQVRTWDAVAGVTGDLAA